MAERFMTIPEIERAAQTILPAGQYGYGAGGSETEMTLRRNRKALDRLAIRQRVLVDVREVDLTTTFLGMELPMPVAIAPMGGLVLFHPRGDVEMVRGAAEGINRMVELLPPELTPALGLSGQTSIRGLTPGHICKAEADEVGKSKSLVGLIVHVPTALAEPLPAERQARRKLWPITRP